MVAALRVRILKQAPTAQQAFLVFVYFPGPFSQTGWGSEVLVYPLNSRLESNKEEEEVLVYGFCEHSWGNYPKTG